MLPHKAIEQRLQEAVSMVVPDADLSKVLVRPCVDPKFGDYQTNALMSLAKARKLNPRQLAADVLSKLNVDQWCEKVEIAGAGFLNFRLHCAAVQEALLAAARGEHLFFDKARQPLTVVVDFSSPNVAKPMHGGHIRSTILGDSLARLLRLLGHRVITDNHIGDWGTQFGMLLVGWKRELDRPALQVDAISELERIYKTIQAEIRQQTKEWLRKHYSAEIGEGLAKGLDEDEVHRRILAALPANKGLNISTTDVASRQELVKLQASDAENLRIWREMLALSQEQFDAIYGRLGVKFDHTLGESFYNPRLPALVEELVAKGIARESEGALAVFFEDIPQLKEHPALIRKSDGGFNYTTTDLATLAHRLETWQPDEVIYVTDGRQQLHFQQVFAAFRKWQSHAPPEGRVTRVPDPDGKDLGLSALVPPKKEVKLAHVWFGSILGEDGKPFKTRSGETVKLGDLLDEAEQRAFQGVKKKQSERSEEDRVPEALWPEIARVVGLGAVKYADLLPNRQSDYVFSWDKMLALNGNTAPYLQYAYARIRSIFRKAAGTSNIQPVLRSSTAEGGHPTSNIQLSASEELALASHLLNFGLVLEAAAEELRPNFVCNYLYDLAGHFTRFYENCPVLKAEASERASRLTLCELTARVLKQGLDSLGIEVLDQM